MYIFYILQWYVQTLEMRDESDGQKERLEYVPLEGREDA